MKECKTDFNTIISRRNTNCGRWDTMDKNYNSHDIIHLGVADMDFRSPPAIIDGFRTRIEHGIFGYTDLSAGFFSSIQRWLLKRHNINVDKAEIVFSPRINISAGICIESLTNPNDEVIINTPAYNPLYQAIVKNGRKVLESPLKQEGNHYFIDFSMLERQITARTKMFILCSPHNPTGRVWNQEELEQISLFCVNHHVILFVDEIHSDLTASGVEFFTTLSLTGKIREQLIVASSPAKTFNIPGVIASYMVIPSEHIRSLIEKDIDRIGMHNPNVFSVGAIENAYTRCDSWYKELLEYLNENEHFTREYFTHHMNKFYIYPREGTFLLWINYTALGCTEKQLETWFLTKAQVSVYMGTAFHEEGRGFFRMNIASPRKVLEQAYSRMLNVYEQIANLIR